MRRSLGSLAAVALLAFSIVAPAEQRGQPLPATTADVTVPPRPLNQGGRGGGTDSTITGGASRSGSGQAVVNLCSIFPSAPECGGPKQGICNDPAAQNYGQPGACIYAPPRRRRRRRRRSLPAASLIPTRLIPSSRPTAMRPARGCSMAR